MTLPPDPPTTATAGLAPTPAIGADAGPDLVPDAPGADPHPRTDFRHYINVHSFRNKLARLAWYFAWTLLFRPTPPQLGAWRNLLLRLFGARVGDAWVHPTVRVWAPWRLTLGNEVAVDRDTFLYNVYGMEVADRVVISQGVFLCGASHDYQITTMPLIGGKIVVGEDTWVAAQAFVGPGVRLGRGSVVGARAVVFKDVAAWDVVAGNPARVVRRRKLRVPADPAATAAATAPPTP